MVLHEPYYTRNVHDTTIDLVDTTASLGPCLGGGWRLRFDISSLLSPVCNNNNNDLMMMMITTIIVM